MFNDLSSPLTFLSTRRSAKPRLMQEPGPSDDQLREILTIGARTPDHGKLFPWRFVVVPKDKREAFSDLLARAVGKTRDRDRIDVPANDEFAKMAPTLVVVLSKPNREHKTPVWEQELSVGAACMNIVHAATASGFTAGWLTGWATYDDTVRDAFGEADEKIAGFIFIGSPGNELEERPRPDFEHVVSTWQG